MALRSCRPGFPRSGTLSWPRVGLHRRHAAALNSEFEIDTPGTCCALEDVAQEQHEFLTRLPRRPHPIEVEILGVAVVLPPAGAKQRAALEHQPCAPPLAGGDRGHDQVLDAITSGYRRRCGLFWAAHPAIWSASASGVVHQATRRALSDHPPGNRAAGRLVRSIHRSPRPGAASNSNHPRPGRTSISPTGAVRARPAATDAMRRRPARQPSRAANACTPSAAKASPPQQIAYPMCSSHRGAAAGN